MAMPSDGTIREVVLNFLLKQNGKLDRAQLEKMGNDELVETVKREVPELNLTAEMLDAKLDGLRTQSSAPYSKGSSDRAQIGL